MTEKDIQEIGKKHYGEVPKEIIRKTIGMCNEVYELVFSNESVILRMNKEKEWIYGTHKFLPLFKQLQIKTPEILIEDYSKESFPVCYQILTKIEGKDLLEVFHTLSPAQLKGIAQEVSNIMDKFQSLPPVESFGGFTGLNESHEKDLLSILVNKRKDIEERNQVAGIFDEEILDIHQRLLEAYTPYFQEVKPRLYYDDLNSKNVMIHEGKFNGLVDLDFLLKGDYLESIGSIQAVWYGTELGEIYLNEILKCQELDSYQRNIINVYTIFTLVGWSMEAGVVHNGNSTGLINWDRIEQTKKKIKAIYASIQG